jgi:hypothetical protein
MSCFLLFALCSNPFFETKFEQHIISIGGVDNSSFLSSYVYTTRIGDSRFIGPGIDFQAKIDGTRVNPHLELAKLRFNSTTFRFGSGFDINDSKTYLTFLIESKF